MHEIARKLIDAGGGVFPTTLEEIKAVGVEDTVARLLMQRVFGSTEIVIGLNIRKITCALDMFDWEETEAKNKRELKMVKVTAPSVRQSLMTWLPKGDWREFQDTVESLGEVLGANKAGYWGQLKAVANKHYSPNEKKKVLSMVEEIIRFFKAKKSGGRKKD